MPSSQAPEEHQAMAAEPSSSDNNAKPDGDQQQEGQGAGLGHRGPAEVQTHPGKLLPGGAGGHHSVRCHQQDELQQHQAVDRRGG